VWKKGFRYLAMAIVSEKQSAQVLDAGGFFSRARIFVLVGRDSVELFVA
jgi:hypothetical protein